MPPTRYIWHVDLATEHGREVYRDDLDPQAIEIARGLLARVVQHPGKTFPLPEMPGMSIIGRAGGRCITLSVLARQRPLQTIAIAEHERCGAVTWRDIVGAPNGAAPRAPWCATSQSGSYHDIVHGDAALHLMMQALGSVIAWAWLDYLAARAA